MLRCDFQVVMRSVCLCVDFASHKPCLSRSATWIIYLENFQIKFFFLLYLSESKVKKMNEVKIKWSLQHETWHSVINGMQIDTEKMRATTLSAMCMHISILCMFKSFNSWLQFFFSFEKFMLNSRSCIPKHTHTNTPCETTNQFTEITLTKQKKKSTNFLYI